MALADFLALKYRQANCVYILSYRVFLP
jgi:hypothetical protein